MPVPNHAFLMCPRFESATELLGKRWSTLVIYVLMDGARRFSEIAEAMPALSERMLSERLKELEAEAILQRAVQPGPPVRVEYTLTEKGRALSGVLEEIGRWAEKWVDVPGAKHAPHSLELKPARARKRSA